MTADWTSDLSVGVHEIDDQHTDIYSLTSRLIQATELPLAADRVEAAIVALGESFIRHFASEERLMLRLRFAGYEPHRAAHEQFIDDFALLKQSIELQEDDGPPPDEIERRVTGWLRSHIEALDRPLAEFLLSKLAA